MGEPMSVDPTAGHAYQYLPDQGTTGQEQPPSPVPTPGPPIPRGTYDDIPIRPLPRDPGYEHVPNPDGSDLGPLYMTPEAERWVDENIIGPGYVVDWGTREIIDPNTGEVKGKVPTQIPRMM